MGAWAGFADYLHGVGLNERTILYYVNRTRAAERWLQAHDGDLMTANATLLAQYAKTLPNSHSTRGQTVAGLVHYWEWIGRVNPPRKAIRVPPRPDMVCRTLEPDETRDLVKVSIGWHPEGTAVLMGLYLALRRFEIAKAEWGRFDDKLTWYRVTGKRDKTATLPVHPVLRSELEGRRGEGWLFPGRFGGAVNPATIWQWIMTVAKAADVPDLTPHRLRHTTLTWAVDSGVQLRNVQTFARHSDPAMTAKYTRTSNHRLQEVVDSLDYLS